MNTDEINAELDVVINSNITWYLVAVSYNDIVRKYESWIKAALRLRTYFIELYSSTYKVIKTSYGSLKRIVVILESEEDHAHILAHSFTDLKVKEDTELPKFYT